jgi:excisionase family DNA binding protein
MNQKFYTVEEISKMLDMHVKTIQRYIREGKIKASKVGKAWKVSGHDLSSFLGETPKIEEQKPAKVSTVVDIELYDKDEVMRITNMLNASLQMKDPSYSGCTLNTMYIESENMLRIMLWGNLKFTEIMIGSIRSLTERE